MANKKRNAVAEDSAAANPKKARKSIDKKNGSGSSIPDVVLELEKVLGQKLQEIKFPDPVKYVYNPVDYAFEMHAKYVREFCNGEKKVLFLGMNPGPWGMSQTGVPFGEVATVKEWFEFSGDVGKPPKEHPDRKVTGLECPRSEVSGKRLWGLFRELCGTPGNFFRDAYVHNYCPIALMDNNAKNITPAELKGPAQKIIHDLCDEVLIELVKLLNVQVIVGIGKFAEKRALTIVKSANLSAKVVSIPHPSPRAAGNQNWTEKASKKLQELDLMKYFPTKASL